MFDKAGTISLNIEKVFQIIGIVLATEQSIKSFAFISEGFYLIFKSTFKIFNDINREKPCFTQFSSRNS